MKGIMLPVRVLLYRFPPQWLDISSWPDKTLCIYSNELWIIGAKLKALSLTDLTSWLGEGYPQRCVHCEKRILTQVYKEHQYIAIKYQLNKLRLLKGVV